MQETNHTIQSYLFFEGRCDEAIQFYKDALGAEVVMLMRFKDSPEPPSGDCPPSPPDKVMHAQIRIGNTVVMLSDGRCGGLTAFGGFGLTFNAATPEEADKAFEALSDKGQVMMPLEKTFFSPRFGMLSDRFGVMWMIMAAPAGK